jgi:hypothetical protein
MAVYASRIPSGLLTPDMDETKIAALSASSATIQETLKRRLEDYIEAAANGTDGVSARSLQVSRAREYNNYQNSNSSA